MVRLVLAAILLVGCGKPGQDPRLQRAIDCIGKPEQAVRDALGRPDRDLAGPNPFEKVLVYNEAQLSIDLVAPEHNGSYAVYSVGTGAIEQAGQYGGAYDHPVFGLHLGDAIGVVPVEWGNGNPGDPSDPPHRKYRSALSTSSGQPISVDVYYKADAAFYVQFVADR